MTKDLSLWILLYVGTCLLQNTAHTYQEVGKQGCTVFRSLYWYWRHHCWSTDIPRNSESYQESKGRCDRGDPKSTQHGTWTNTWQHSKADFWESGKVEYWDRVSCLEVKFKLCMYVYMCVWISSIQDFSFRKVCIGMKARIWETD